MKILSIHDYGKDQFDRYTIVLNEKHDINGILNMCLGMSDNPTHPQGFCQHSSCQIGDHLGKKIKFNNLPKECQNVLNNMEYKV